jgi:Txe/YoeB family toxin of Txe-Axe toxin-antitoxin module
MDKKQNDYKIILPSAGKGLKEIKQLLQNKKAQTTKAIEKLRKNPTDFTQKGIEKIDNHALGEFTIRVTRGDRIFYDVNMKKKEVYLLRAGSHDLYRLI